MINYEIKIKDEAVEDLLNAVKWYEEQQGGLGDKFQHQVILHIDSLNIQLSTTLLILEIQGA